MHDTVLVGAGEQAECRLSCGPPLSSAAEVRFYPKARPLALVTGPGSQVKPTTTAGYPAGERVLSTGTDGQIIADTQGLATLYNGPAGEPVETSCDHDRQLADVVTAIS